MLYRSYATGKRGMGDFNVKLKYSKKNLGKNLTTYINQ